LCTSKFHAPTIEHKRCAKKKLSENLQSFNELLKLNFKALIKSVFKISCHGNGALYIRGIFDIHSRLMAFLQLI